MLSSGNDTDGLIRAIAMSGAGRRHRRQRGGDFLGIGNFFRKTVPNAAKKAWNYVKTKPLSTLGTVAGFIPGVGGIAGKALGVAGKLTGTGRRRRRRVGGSIASVLKKAHDFIKTNRIASKGLRHFGLNTLAKSAHAAGYGRRKRIVRRRRRVGGSIGSVLKKAHEFIKSNRLASKGLRHFGFNTLAKSAHAAGYGRRRRVVRRRRRGGAIGSILKKAHEFIKSNRLASKGLRHFGFNTLAKSAHAAGYGRRRRVYRRR